MPMNSTGDISSSPKIGLQKNLPWEEIKITTLSSGWHRRDLTVCYRYGKPYKVAIHAIDANPRYYGHFADLRYFFGKDYFEYHRLGEYGKTPGKMEPEDKEEFKEEFTDAYNNIKNEYRGEKKDSILQLLDNILKKL